MWSNMWSGGFFDHLGLRGKCLYRRRIKGLRGWCFPTWRGSDPLPKQARYQLRYTRLWNCFICGLSCGLSRFLTNGFAEIVPASDGVPAVCEVGLFPSWMGGIRSQITRAANYATFGHRYFSRPRAFFPTYVRQYTLRSAALALWHHLLLDRGQHDGFILYLSILPVSPPKSSLFASGRYVGKAVRRLWGLRTA